MTENDMPNFNNNMPSFKITGKSRGDVQVFLHCSNRQCQAMIREIKPHHSVDLTRAYHCKECESGNVITLNLPVNRTTDSKVGSNE